jgi:peptidoglycan/LPS O-acetylase OafA/YrhL
MEQVKQQNKSTLKRILILWVLACIVAGYFIPYYDLGFDGVKIWFYLCVVMLAILLGGRWFYRSMQQGRSSNA